MMGSEYMNYEREDWRDNCTAGTVEKTRRGAQRFSAQGWWNFRRGGSQQAFGKVLQIFILLKCFDFVAQLEQGQTFILSFVFATTCCQIDKNLVNTRDKR